MKNTAEQLREEVVLMADDSCCQVRRFRRSAASVDAEGMDLGKRRRRSAIRDKLQLRAAMVKAVMDEQRNALAMPRGSGKTTIAECACVWTIRFGHREFVALIGASEIHAADNWKPSKKRSRERIDGIVALIMALDRATTVTPVSKCWYTRRELCL